MSPARTASPRRRLSAEERRESILGAARDVFVESGLGAARIVDIAERAEVNQALLYQHFRSKEEIFEAAVAGPLETALRAAVDAAPPVGGDDGEEVVEERLRMFFISLIGQLSELSPLLGVTLFVDAESPDSFYRARFLPLVDELADVVIQNIPHWDPRGFDVRQTVIAAMGMCLTVSLDRRVGANDDDPAATADSLTRLIMDGLRER